MKSKIFDSIQAVNIVKIWQQQGLEVVFTNGCFDLLHVGHVRYLNHSASLGDKLIVALNSDDSVKRLKGANRPINTLNDRMEIMAALECVDAVTNFGEDTPLEIIQHILPDIITKGGDYTAEQVVGGSEVIDAGGKVVIIDFEKGYSTTATIEKSGK